MTEEEMRHALFGSKGAVEPAMIPPIQPHAVVVVPSIAANKRNEKAKSFTPKLKVTLRVGNEFEGETELFIYEADTLSTLQAEMDAMKVARKRYRFIELVSVKPAN